MRCYLCRRRMLPSWITRWVFKSRMNCGGDCWRCIREIEGVEDEL